MAFVEATSVSVVACQFVQAAATATGGGAFSGLSRSALLPASLEVLRNEQNVPVDLAELSMSA